VWAIVIKMTEAHDERLATFEAKGRSCDPKGLLHGSGIDAKKA